MLIFIQQNLVIFEYSQGTHIIPQLIIISYHLIFNFGKCSLSKMETSLFDLSEIQLNDEQDLESTFDFLNYFNFDFEFDEEKEKENVNEVNKVSHENNE